MRTEVRGKPPKGVDVAEGTPGRAGAQGGRFAKHYPSRPAEAILRPVTAAMGSSNLSTLTDLALAGELCASRIIAGNPLPAYTDADFQLEEQRKANIRTELSKRGYADEEIAAIQDGDWTVLHRQVKADDIPEAIDWPDTTAEMINEEPW